MASLVGPDVAHRFAHWRNDETDHLDRNMRGDRHFRNRGHLRADAAGTSGTTAPSPAAAAGAPTAGATGTSGAAESKFILTGASATPAEAATAQTYRLVANPTALSEHVGKKLELVGTIDTTSTPDPKDPSAAAPAFKVESGKIVAATCSE